MISKKTVVALLSGVALAWTLATPAAAAPNNANRDDCPQASQNGNAPNNPKARGRACGQQAGQPTSPACPKPGKANPRGRADPPGKACGHAG